MLQRVSGVEHLTADHCPYIDCYVSTDASEVEGLLEGAGFVEARFLNELRAKLWSEYEDPDLYETTVMDPKTKLVVDCVDLPLEQALNLQEDAGFMSMSQLRVYLKGSQRVEAILLPIRNALQEARQNMAFVDSSSSVIFPELSEFYR